MNPIINVVLENASSKERKTLIFAAEELQKYMQKVLNERIEISIDEPMKNNQIVIGIGMEAQVMKVPDKELDDAIFIDVESLHGKITGSNARSVLIAVYRFLREIGFSFIKPGENGEKIPDVFATDRVYVLEKASLRHRGICIEGSLFKEYLPKIIDWLPKVALNSYFIQFRTVEAFVNRWYKSGSLYREAQPLSEAEIEKVSREAEKEIEKRGILYHAVGHGWTSEILGMDVNNWNIVDEPLSKDKEKITAMVNGKRGIHKKIPLDTNLCYSNANVRNIMTDNILNYCKNHPEINFLHFWLADGRNNNCECEECATKRTSDYYVMMLNELDEKLTNQNIKTKIVFLIYVDLLWRPISEKIKNKERFVLMFAPITRSFSESINPDVKGETAPYVLNNLEFPHNVADAMQYLREWQEVFDGDSFDYDYHLMWDHYLEFSYHNQSRVLYEDICNLKRFGLNGIVAPLAQRVFLPTAFAMQIMAESLWNTECDYELVKKRSFLAEFGENYEIATNYLENLSKYNCSQALRGEEPFICEENFEKLRNGIKIADLYEKRFSEIILKIENSRIKHSWEGLKFHAELHKKLFNLYLNVESEEKDNLKAEVIDFVRKNEDKFKNDFDEVLFCERLYQTLAKIQGDKNIWR